MPRDILTTIEGWKPKPRDEYGRDKKLFLRYMRKHCLGVSNAKSIEEVMKSISLSKKYKKEQFQHKIIVPLREQRDFFIGTGTKGIYLVCDATDVHTTVDFYAKRIRSEHKHLRNLKSIARRYRLVGVSSKRLKNPQKCSIFLDESGTPSLADKGTSPFFIVSGIVFEHKNPDKMLTERFAFIRKELNFPENYEFKSSSLNRKQYIRILKELGPIDYDAACVCFVKKALTGKGFHFPKVFYKYAFQYLLNDLLDYVGQANLFFDEYSSEKSRFRNDFLKYIKQQNASYAYQKIDKAKMVQSVKSPSAQMADLIAGAMKWKLMNKADLLPLIDEKLIFVRVFPPGIAV
jgi:hypothetical protein